MSWQIDNAHTAIEFAARHMMISKVRGRFESFSGTVNLDEQNPQNTTVDVTIEAASINTREAQRDGHLRSPDFLDVATYPEIRFVSTQVERTGNAAAKLHGDLTIRGVTRPVVLDVEYVGKSKSPWGTTNYGFTGRTRLSRKEWGLNWNVALETGGWLVSDEITVEIEIELVKMPEQQPEAAEAVPA
jgi:polyisoprenoid-binding protein YceI